MTQSKAWSVIVIKSFDNPLETVPIFLCPFSSPTGTGKQRQRRCTLRSNPYFSHKGLLISFS